MKIPKRLRIGGFIWEVKEDFDIKEEGGIHGSTHYKKQKIFLDPEISQQKKEQTLLHEIMHAIWWQTGLWERYKEEPTKKIEEEIIHALSMGIYQVLKENRFLR